MPKMKLTSTRYPDAPSQFIEDVTLGRIYDVETTHGYALFQDDRGVARRIKVSIFELVEEGGLTGGAARARLSSLSTYQPGKWDFREPGKGKVSSVDHPAHYGGADSPTEAIKVVEAWGLNFNTGNALKYISRAGKKSGNVMEDLKKAVWYLNREIQNREQAKEAR